MSVPAPACLRLCAYTRDRPRTLSRRPADLAASRRCAVCPSERGFSWVPEPLPSPRCPEQCLRRPGPALCAPPPEPCASHPCLRVTLLGTRARVAAGTSLCSSLILSTQEPSWVAGGHLPRSRPGWCTGAPLPEHRVPSCPRAAGWGAGTHGPASRVSLQQDNAI